MSIRALAIFLVVPAATVAAAPAASAHYLEKCWIKYRYEQFWTNAVPATCDYYTGEELNGRGDPHVYARYKAFVIAFAEGGSVTIRIDQPLQCGFVAEDSCAEQISHLLTGRDEYRWYWRGREWTREWAICQPGVIGECSARGFFDR
jgi:hypothetical protein